MTAKQSGRRVTLGESDEGPSFRFALDPTQLIEEMVRAGGYGVVNPNITTALFGVESGGVVEWESRYCASRDELLRVTTQKKSLWIPARVRHVLAHGRAFPEEQRAGPIIGVGSVVKIRNCRFVPYLGMDESKRSLGLRALDREECEGTCRFLVVRVVLALTSL